MKKVNEKNLTINYQIRWIFYGALIITLFFDSQAQDPFNSPKLWVLILFTPILVGYLVTTKINLSDDDRKFFRLLSIFVFLYLLIILTSASFAYSWQVATLGETFRRNGLITYIGFITFFIASVKFVRFDNIFFGLKIIFITGSLTGLYSLIQISGKDWVKWTAANQVISTFGNTNFSGAGMTLFAVITFGLLLINYRNKTLLIGYFLIFNILVYAIIRTNARQAIIMLFISITVFLSLFLYRKNKIIWIYANIVMISTFFLMALALFKIGPLQNLVYKSSVSVREYYWRAGIEMFKHNPLLGVGPDSYGIFFKEFREPNYPLNYGWGLTSSNAHNIFIQNFATGGIFLGLIYILIQILITYRSIKLIRNTAGSKQLIATLLFSTWLAYELMSLVSIEFIGVSIWGWIIGGSLVGLSFQNEVLQTSNSNLSIKINFPRLAVTLFLLAISFSIVIPLRQSEKSAWITNILIDQGNTNQVKIFNTAVDKVVNNRFSNTDYKNLVAANLIRLGDNDQANKILTNSIERDPRNLDTLALLVDINEKNGDYKLAIYYRNQIAKFDPWNAQNYLGLAQLYKVTNDPSNMKLMVEKIMSFASSDPIAEVAKKEFTQTLN